MKERILHALRFDFSLNMIEMRYGRSLVGMVGTCAQAEEQGRSAELNAEAEAFMEVDG